MTEYINEVQRVAEAYINLFDELLEESKLAEVYLEMYVQYAKINSL